MKQLFFTTLLIFFCLTSAFSEEKNFTILHTSDEHSAFLPMPFIDYHPENENPTVGGFARLATAIKQIKAEKEKDNEPVLIFSSGDNIGGSPFSWLILNKEVAEVEMMNYMGYNATTVGNHEFDYGPDILASYYSKAGYEGNDNKMSILMCNLKIPEGHALNNIQFKENEIYELPNGLTVGIFGLIGGGAYKLATDAPPIEYINDIESAKKQVAFLQSKNVDVIVAITHSGDDEDIELANSVDGIDIILGGHYHIKTEEPIFVNNTYIFHPDYFVKHLGKYEFAYDTETSKLSFRNKGNSLIKLTSKFEEDSLISSKVNYYINLLNDVLIKSTDSVLQSIDMVVALSKFDMEAGYKEEFGLGNFVTDAMKIMGERATGKKVDFAFQANGTIRSDIIPGKMPWSKEKISFFDLASVVPLGMGNDGIPGYPLVSIYATEQEVIRAAQITSILHQIYGDIFFLQFSGLRYTYDPGKAFWLTLPIVNLPIPANKAILSIEKYIGEGIQDTEEYEALDEKNDKMYHIVTDYYIASFLPMVGEILPQLKIVLKDENGHPIEKLDHAIVHNGDKEYKVWHSVLEYALTYSGNDEYLSEYYSTKQGRIIKEEGIPLYVWSYTLLVIFLLLIIFLILKLIKRLKAAKS